MSCIIVELATLIVYDWKSEKVSEFRCQRQDNPTKRRPNLASQHKDDFSFHNNWTIVEKWMYQLQVDDDSRKLMSTLKVARRMMNEERNKRLYAWEAELDLYNIQQPDDDRIARLEKGALCVQAPPPQANLIGTQTPFHRAALDGDRTRLRQLHEAGWSMFVTDDKGLTPREIFRQNHHADLSDLLPNMEDTEKQGQDLLKAAGCGDIDKVRDLLHRGVDAMFVDQDNCSALYIAANHNKGPVAECLLQSRGKELLRQKDKRWGDTPLHKAASRGHAKMVREFLEWSPNIEDKQNQGKTALFLAVEWGNDETVEILLNHGALVFTQTNTGVTPLHDAAKNNRQRILRRLLTTPDASKCLEHRNMWGDTPLWFALNNLSPECAEILLNNGASLRVSNKNNQSVVHVTVMRNLYEFLKRHIHRFSPDDLESRNMWNHTPLQLAQYDQKPDFIELLTPPYHRI